MASDKNAMLSTAKYFIGKVTKAKNACDTASKSMVSPQYEVSGNWSGASGEAMAAALNDLRSEISTAYSRLAALETQMRNQANSIYNNWTEEEEQ